MNDIDSHGPSRGGDHDPSEREERSSHLSDYVALLRARPVLFSLTFLLVCCGIFARALFAPPVFRSYSALQVEDQKAPGGILGELEAMEGGSTTETEIEILRSRTVALEAARKLEPGFCATEEHAYRPLEVLLGSFWGRPAPLPITVATSAVEEEEPPESYVFDFRGAGLVVERHSNPEGTRFGGVTETAAVEGFAPGAPFDAFGREFTVEAKAPLDGRRYRLVLHSPSLLADRIRDDVTVEEMGHRTGIIHIGFEAEDPRVAQMVAQSLADSYLDLKSGQRRSNLDKALAFLGDEIRTAGERLKASEEALDRFRTESGAVLLSDRATWIVEKTSSLDLERAEQRVVLAELERERDAVAAGGEAGLLATVRAGGDVDPTTTALSQELVRLQVERDGLVECGAKAAHPQLRRLEAEIRSARERLEANRKAMLGRGIEHVRARMEHLERTVAGYEQEARTLPEAERKITELSREVRADTEIYSFLVQKQQETQFARASTLASVRSIDPAFVPPARESPKLLLQGLLALTAGLFGAVFLCFFAAYLDRSVRSVRALGERTGLPVYAAVPDFRSVGERRGLAGMLVTRDRPASMLAEVYRTLLANLRYARLDGKVKTLAVTSAMPAEGKTVTLVNLAVAAAALGERVILVDADLRRPAVHTHFDVDIGPGLTELLRGAVTRDQALRATGVENLTIVTAGASVPNPGALLPAFGRLLDELKEQYDWVLVDMPPVLAVADPSVLLSRLDAVLLVVRYGVRSLDAALRARDQICHVGGNLLGLVFNAVDVKREKRASYGGGYGYGYGYGYGHRHDRGGLATPPERAGRAKQGASRRGGGEAPPGRR